MEETASVNFVQVIIVGMLMMFLFVVVIVFFVLIYQRKLVNEKLKTQELKLSQERKLLHNSFRVQEEERKIFAANLHDELGAQLSLTKMTVSSLVPEPETKKTIENSLVLLNDMADSIRRISYNLHPPSLSRLGLGSAIREFIKKIEKPSTEVIFEEHGEGALSEEINLQLFRIVQEALNNALKYSEASEIRLTIAQTREGAKLTIKDNGKGFSINDSIGLGILNMKSRSEMIQYSCEIDSNPSGTAIIIAPKLNSL